MAARLKENDRKTIVAYPRFLSAILKAGMPSYPTGGNYFILTINLKIKDSRTLTLGLRDVIVFKETQSTVSLGMSSNLASKLSPSLLLAATSLTNPSIISPAATSALLKRSHQSTALEENPTENHSSGGAEVEGERVQKTETSGMSLPYPTETINPPTPSTSDQQPISSILIGKSIQASTSINPKEPQKIDLSSSEELSYEDPSTSHLAHTSSQNRDFSKAP